MERISIEQIGLAHHLIAEFHYQLQPVIHGYANRSLYINLDQNEIIEKPVTQEMKDIFTGGRGFCLWLLWNSLTENTLWNDPNNELVIAGGVIGGISSYPGSGKCTVVTISPLTHSIIDSNSGGYFGPYLKFAGWDALEIQGKAKNDVVILIDGDNGSIRIEEAPLEAVDTHILLSQLYDLFTINEKDRRNISVISAGQAADHVPMCGLNISYYDPRKNEVRIKQAARGGAGRVLRDKKIKAILVKYSHMTPTSNGVADLALI